MREGLEEGKREEIASLGCSSRKERGQMRGERALVGGQPPSYP